MGPKIWNALRFIARPISNCRLLLRIASQLPHFRTVKFFPIPSGSETKLNPEYLVEIPDAWTQLVSRAPSSSEIKKIAKFRDKFKRDCARSFGSHAEIQLFLHYMNNVCPTPSIDYFGCSKKTCFLCEVFLRATSHPISTRGRHGICYPAWGVPFSRSNEVAAALLELEKVLVSRIEMHLKGQSGEAFLNQVPQSTIISDFQGLSLEEISRKDGMKKFVEEKRKTLQSERRIL
jgi:OTT_1508-like deaminase